jgi:hypothetical protein
MAIRLQINLKRAIHNSKVIYWRLLAGTAIMRGQKKLFTFVARRTQPVLGRERKTNVSDL